MSLVSIKNSIIGHKGIIQSIGAVAGGNFAGAVLGAAGGLLVARFVTPEVYGQFRVFTIPLMYLTFLHLGTFDGLQRQIPFFVGRGQQDHAERLASTAGAWNLGMTIVVACGFALYALYNLWQGNYQSAVGWFTQAVCCLTYYTLYLNATYRTLNHFVTLARVHLIQAVTLFLLVAAVALWGFYGMCLRYAIPAILGAWLLHRSRPLPVRLRFDFQAFKEVIRIGLPLSCWGTLYTSLWLAVEYSLMLHLAGVKAVGLFGVAVVLRESMNVLPHAIRTVFAPRVVAAYGRGGTTGKYTKKLSALAAGIALFMLAVVYLASVCLDYLVPFFLPKYVDGLVLMKICLSLSIIHALSIPFSGLVATGRSWLFGRGILAGIVVFPVAVYLLEPYLGGMLAVAVGSLLGRLVRTIVAYWDLFSLMRQEG